MSTESPRILIGPELSERETITMQPEFPVVDLTDENAEKLELLLANKDFIKTHHQASELNMAFRVLHPTLIAGASTAYDGRTIDALSHGMMVFEALHAAVTSPVPSRIGQNALMFVVGLSESEKLMTDLSRTKEASEEFTNNLPKAAKVIENSSERFFGDLTYVVVAGAGLECYFTKRSLDIQFQLDHN